MCQMPRAAQSSLTAVKSDSGYTAPVGLLGEIVTMARVRGVMASAMASRRSWYCSSVGTTTGRQPAITTAISWLK